ncbi:hypothetical protein TNCV_917911 [Trichonephila clavipes]|nr:hypothetical protein TNCV_917911 [Trichonephila clavipes]
MPEEGVELGSPWSIKQPATEWNQVVFSYESRFNLNRDDNRVRVRRPMLNASIMSQYNDTLLRQLTKRLMAENTWLRSSTEVDLEDRQF